MSLDVHLFAHKEQKEDEEPLYWANITHNLGTMAKEAGIYKALWRPDENGYIQAKDIIPIVEKGLQNMIDRPSYFEQFDSPNGWGLYKHFVPWIAKYLEALKQYPNSYIIVGR